MTLILPTELADRLDLIEHRLDAVERFVCVRGDCRGEGCPTPCILAQSAEVPE